MIRHLPELIQTGVTSFKIEGRMKGIHYLATVVKTYRDAIDTYAADPQTYTFNQRWAEELAHVYHRDYSTGFFSANPRRSPPITKMSIRARSTVLSVKSWNLKITRTTWWRSATNSAAQIPWLCCPPLCRSGTRPSWDCMMNTALPSTRPNPIPGHPGTGTAFFHA